MLRSRAASATAWVPDGANPSVDTPLLTSLAGQTTQSRAVENDYCDNPSSFKPPIVACVLGKDPAHRKSADRKTRPHRSRRHHAHLPGSAARVFMGTASLPSDLVTREVRRSSEAAGDSCTSRPHPVIPPRPHAATIGHCTPRRCISEDLGCHGRTHTVSPITPPREIKPVFMFTRTDSSTPPPRPPPSGPKAVSPVGVVTNNLPDYPHGTESSNRAPNLNQRISSPKIVQAQPQSTSSVRQKSNSISKKSLVVELNDDTSTKTRTAPTDATSDSKMSKKDDSKKPTHRDARSRHIDEDHELLEINMENRAKPGMHNYNCPRCGKCMCSRCTRDISGTSKANYQATSYNCGNRCVCSVDSCVETATCFCIARGIFYHCSNYEDNEICTDKPCSCKGTRWCSRWSALGALSLVLPCLLCYPVARGCVRLCRWCSSCTRPGCRCKESCR